MAARLRHGLQLFCGDVRPAQPAGCMLEGSVFQQASSSEFLRLRTEMFWCCRALEVPEQRNASARSRHPVSSDQRGKKELTDIKLAQSGDARTTTYRLLGFLGELPDSNPGHHAATAVLEPRPGGCEGGQRPVARVAREARQSSGLGPNEPRSERGLPGVWEGPHGVSSLGRVRHRKMQLGPGSDKFSTQETWYPLRVSQAGKLP